MVEARLKNFSPTTSVRRPSWPLWRWHSVSADCSSLSQARIEMVGKATTQAGAGSFVDNQTDAATNADPNSDESSEAKVHETFGWAMLLFAVGVDVILGYLTGLLAHMRTEPDFAAWRELGGIRETVLEIQKQIAERLASVEITKNVCMAGFSVPRMN
jgi:hypothetical protein